jgi:hypothetical protein
VGILREALIHPSRGASDRLCPFRLHKLLEKPGWVAAKSFTNFNEFDDVQASFGAFVF